MMNRLIYAFELLLLLPFFPFLYWKGKSLREQVQRLPQHSTYLKLSNSHASKRVLVIGESTAAGVGASSPETTFAARLFEASKGDFEVLNLGKNGLKAARLPRLLTHAKPDIPTSFDRVIILIGANDCFKFTPPGKFRKELKAFIEIFEQLDSTQMVFIPAIAPVNHFPAIPALLRFFLGVHRYILNKEIYRLSKNLHKLYFHDWKTSFTDEFFASDGIHPSDLGYEKMAEEAYRFIKG
ncbi:SGNH/GDSL hydrolase family protein [Mongoliitalea daihaiensis]|uniref:SGNH/GDSL hydrolase family protein n=1 Tax=Mongoliitalea daihaiensis TaxID=2782006 RepID=UPI001F3EAD9E|nr:SGNH/GDSL hydrolase family protein [Mongoliitalea daihaiensis]UJP63462.1 SGNH/GDSL hydrolase family protein [Mongoliitalea daihaiensis]